MNSQSQILAQDTPDSASVVDLGTVLSVLWRRKLIVIVTFLVMAFWGVYKAYIVEIPRYTSTAVVMLNNREEQVIDLESVVGGLGVGGNRDSTVVNTEVEILRSRSLLGKVVDRLDLTRDPEFNGALTDPSARAAAIAAAKAQVKLWMEQFLGLTTATDAARTPEEEALRAAEAEQSTRNDAISALLRNLDVRNVSNSLVFEISVTSENARKSAQIADTLVELYILDQLEVKYEATQQATEWLTDRVADLQVSLEAAEAEVKAFRASTDLVSPDALQALEVQLKDTRDRLDDLGTAQAADQARLAALRAATTPKAQAAAAEDSQLTQLLPRIGQPSIAQAFNTRFAQILSRTELNLTRNEAQRLSLEASRDDLETQINRQSGDLITLQQLTREAEASRLLYEYFLSRLKETSAQEGIQQADSRILSRAVIPSQASEPRKSLIVASNGILGILIGLALILVLEARHRAFRTSEELETATGYAVLGQVPTVPVRKRRSLIDYIAAKPTSAAAEAVRNLRTSVLLSNVDNPPKVVMVCSSVPGEGKTTLSMVLAVNFAQMGRKTLLIEGDVRRRVFRQYLQGQSGRGVVDILAGKAAVQEMVQHDALFGVDVLAGGESKSNAADLFSSNRFAELLAGLREEYDQIIIDSPPVLVVPDARIIAQQVDAVLFAVKWDKTPPAQVQAALRAFENGGRRVAGLVLNQISPRGMRRYGYGGRYGAYAAYGAKYYNN